MGTLLDAVKAQNEALRKAREGKSKWSTPARFRKSPAPGSCRCFFPGVDVFGVRPGPAPRPDQDK